MKHQMNNLSLPEKKNVNIRNNKLVKEKPLASQEELCSMKLVN
jgi:hypothetical protein